MLGIAAPLSEGCRQGVGGVLSMGHIRVSWLFPSVMCFHAPSFWPGLAVCLAESLVHNLQSGIYRGFDMTLRVCSLHSLFRTWAFPRCCCRPPPRLLESLIMVQCPLPHTHMANTACAPSLIVKLQQCSIMFAASSAPSACPMSSILHLHTCCSFLPSSHLLPIFLAAPTSNLSLFPSYLLRLPFLCQLGFAWGGEVFILDLK